MDVFELQWLLVEDYARYTRSFIKIADERIKARVDGALDGGQLWPEPLLQLNPTFLPGGTIDVPRLQRIGADKDMASLDLLVREIAGRAAPPLATAEGSLETILLGRLSRRTRNLSRDEDPVGTVLDYAWRVYIHARNQSLLLHAAHLDAARLEKELVA